MSLGLIIFLVVIGTTIWVGIDGSKRDWPEGKTGTGGWVLGCLLLWIVFFPWYLAKRTGVPLKDVAKGADPSQLPAPQERTHRQCPHCKEAMRRDASVCPHCRMPSPAWTFHEGRWWFRADDAAPWQWLDETTGAWTDMVSESPVGSEA